MILRTSALTALTLLALSAIGCQSSSSAADHAAVPDDNKAVPENGPTHGDSVQGRHATVGQPAPDFELKDLDGKTVKLSEFKGKTVVLEWFNPGCPFVKAAHTKGSLRDTAKRATDAGVVWLAVNSASAGKQGNGVEANRAGASTFGLTHPILLDEAGTVGHLYGATNTPHMFVIDPKGTLVYAGGIDNSQDGEGESPEGGKLVNYVDAALTDITAGRPVAKPTSAAYGCGVKYASK